ncbi:MAG: hypothetical protein LUE93_00480 [Bacteroides sp.]|nr:hypothetical protein [Bacteroides sp.]
MANLIRMNRFKTVKSSKTEEGGSSQVILEKVYKAMDRCQVEFDRIYQGILEEMEEKGICVKNEKELTEEQSDFCRKYFFGRDKPMAGSPDAS